MLHYKPTTLLRNEPTLKEELFVDTDGSVALYYDFDKGCFEITFSGVISDKSFKKVHRTLFQELNEKPGRKILFDFMYVTKTDILSRAWYSSVFIMSLFRQHGSKFNMAIVKPQNLFESKNIEIMFRSNLTAGQKGELRFFNEIFDCTKWLTF